MGTRGWTLSSFVGCCLWILHGTSHIFLRAQVLPKPLQGTAGTLMRCFSLLAALESPLTTSPCNTWQPKSWKSVLQGRHRPEGLVAGVDPCERQEPSPGSLCAAVYPASKRAKGSQLAERGSRDAPIPPTSRRRADAGALCWGPSCTSFP